MTDRDSFLLAIHAADPADRLPRLAYADWLDDHPELPGAAATAEFIRLSCKTARKGASFAPARDAWLAANWKRLIPSVVALSVPITEPYDLWPVVPEGGMGGITKGRLLQTYVTLPGVLTNSAGWSQTKLYSCRLVIQFWRGLASYWKMPSKFGRDRTEPALKADRPELFLDPAVAILPPDARESA